MGFRFRKSFKIGPFRFTASKSGISYSVGVKGARVTKRADGKTQTTLSIPGTGISHVSTSGGARAEKQSKAADEPQCVKSATDILQERPSPYEFVKFYLSNTQSTNEDGQSGRTSCICSKCAARRLTDTRPICLSCPIRTRLISCRLLSAVWSSVTHRSKKLCFSTTAGTALTL